MPTRRDFILQASGLIIAGIFSGAMASLPRKLVFVHGRSQQGKDPIK